MAFIELKNICKRYSNAVDSHDVLKNLNLSINQKEFVALMGSSGSGKSTLMNILGCLDKPTSGFYQLDGQEISQLDHDQLAEVRNRTIGFVFQGFNLLPRTTVINNVMLPLLYAGMPKAERYKRARMLLEKVGLGHRLDSLPSQISGGEQQRVAIARSLANNPKLLLADEPTGNLDAANSEIVMELFQKLHQEGLTIILVTHELDIAEYAERQIKMLDGKIIDDHVV